MLLRPRSPNSWCQIPNALELLYIFFGCSNSYSPLQGIGKRPVIEHEQSVVRSALPLQQCHAEAQGIQCQQDANSVALLLPEIWGHAQEGREVVGLHLVLKSVGADPVKTYMHTPHSVALVGPQHLSYS